MSFSTQEIKEHLFEIADAKYKEFHGGLVPGCDTIIGVRVPVLRQYAKELLKEETAEALLDIIDCRYYEEIMLQGMIIGLQPKTEWATIKTQIIDYVPLIDNWGTCDIFCAGLKITKKHKDEIYEMIVDYIASEQEFERRFGVVMLLDYYVEEAYLQKIFELFDSMNLEGYYVQMAVAWAISVCLVKYYNETLEYLKRCKLDDFTYNKALQKGIESYRLTKEQKAAIRAMKRT